MEIEQIKDYLKNYRVLLTRVRRLKEMMGICPEKAQSYKEKIEQTLKLRDKIEEEIDHVDGGVLSEILSQKYICGKTLEEIALGINYSKRQTERLHIKALQKLCIS